MQNLCFAYVLNWTEKKTTDLLDLVYCLLNSLL